MTTNGEAGKKLITTVIASQAVLNVAMLGWLFVVTTNIGDRFTGTQASSLIERVSVLETAHTEYARRLVFVESNPYSKEVLRRLDRIEQKFDKLEERLRMQELSARQKKTHY